MPSITKPDNVLTFLNTLDIISPLLGSLVTEEKFIDLSTLNSRYYIALHDILLPVPIKESEDTIPKVVLVPNTTIYIHEQKIFAIFKARFSEILSANVSTYIPVVDLSLSENLLMITSSALAYRIISAPSEKNILRIMPNNIRTYMEVALKIYEDMMNSIPNNVSIDRQTPSIIEFILWIDEAKSHDIAEIRYFRGITMRIFKIVHQNYEIDLKCSYPFPHGFIIELISILPYTIIASIVNNIENTFKIILAYKLMNQ